MTFNVQYWFNMISKPLVYNLHELVLNHSFTTVKKCCSEYKNEVMLGYHHSTSAVIDKKSAGWLLMGPAGGLWIRTLGEATMVRGHVD